KGIPGARFEDAIEARGEDDLRALVEEFKRIYRDETGEDVPQDPRDQLEAAIRAVFDSWLGDRAVHYRRLNRIPDEWGTAVNVQQMVFGNRGDDSCSGVAFSRDEVTVEPSPSGDFLPNAQGEDVVSGVLTPRDLSELKDSMPEAHAELMDILTSKGGKASHAALVARGMGKPCVAGAGELEVDLKAKRVRAGDTELGEGDTIAIDGSTGEVTADDVPLEAPEMSDAFQTVLG